MGVTGIFLSRPFVFYAKETPARTASREDDDYFEPYRHHT